MLKFAILAVALVCQINTIASVMMADIAAAFPGASDVAVQYVMQSGMIGGFVVALLMSVLSTRFRKKPMILIGLVAILVGGLLPFIPAILSMVVTFVLYIIMSKALDNVLNKDVM